MELPATASTAIRLADAQPEPEHEQQPEPRHELGHELLADVRRRGGNDDAVVWRPLGPPE